MTYPRPLLVLVALASGACVTPSKSLGAAESSGSEGGDETTTGAPACAPTPSFECTAPLDPSLCSDDPSSTFDADCCMRPACESSAECTDGLVCAPAVIPWACSDQVEDGETVCSCGAPPDGRLRSVCVPPEVPSDEWCNNFWTEGECNDAPPIESDTRNQFCRWIEVHTLSVEGDACTVDGPEGRCLTFDVNPEQGCGPVPCWQGALQLQTAIARGGPETFEVFGLHDVFCGEGRPVGDWISAADASLGACAMQCGLDDPCGVPLAAYLEARGEASKDAPVDDCGHVTQADDVAAWQSAHDCVVQHAMAGEGFRVVGDLVPTDSMPQVGYLGLQGESYAVSGFSADMGGIDPGSLFEEPGAGIEAPDGCVVAVGELCLAVTAPGDVVQHCPG